MSEKAAEIKGRAALALLESLLVSLVEKEILNQDDIDEVFDTAVDAFRTAHRDGLDGDNDEIARLLERVQAEGNGVTSR